MDDKTSCMNGSGWIWAIAIIIIIIIILLLWWWAWPWCSSCTPNVVSSNKPTVIYINVAEKDSSHPNYNRGSNMGYVIDGVQGKSLVLKAGRVYRFNVSATGHPFYIGTSERGNGPSDTCPGALDIGGTPTESGSFPFIPTLEMPQPLYYACCNHPHMGSSIIIEP